MKWQVFFSIDVDYIVCVILYVGYLFRKLQKTIIPFTSSPLK